MFYIFRTSTLSPMLNPDDEICTPEIFYHPQRSCGKVMFLHLSVILSTGGVSDRHPRADTPRAGTPLVDTHWADTPWADTPLGRHPPRQTPPLHPPPPRRPLQRTVRILLECILVL